LERGLIYVLKQDFSEDERNWAMGKGERRGKYRDKHGDDYVVVTTGAGTKNEIDEAERKFSDACKRLLIAKDNLAKAVNELVEIKAGSVGA
jgi:hypothetical protein